MLRAEAPGLKARLLRRPVISDWRRSVLLLASLAVLLYAYRDVIRGREWILTTILVVTLVLATCAVLRALGAPLAWLGGIVVWFVALVWIFVPETLYVVVPSPSSVSGLQGLWGQARSIMGDEVPPVAAAKPIVYVIAASFGIIAILLDSIVFGLRKPVLAGAVFVGLYVFPPAASGHKPNALTFLAIAALWLALLRTEGRPDRGPVAPGVIRGSVPTMVVAISALAVSVALPPALPHVANIAIAWGKPPPGAFDRGINPILELGQNLRRNSPVTSLQFTTTDNRAPYLKVATLLDFNGKAWKPSNAVKYGRIEGNVGLYREVARKEIKTKISIRHLSSPRLPVPYPALEVSGLTGDWEWEAQGLTLKSDTSDSTNQTYTITSLKIEPTLAQMRGADAFIGSTLKRYVALPKDMPASITKTAAEVTAGAANNYDKAIALQSYFRDGSFSYSETAPVAKGYDGSGVGVIAEFLKVKGGYCVHFSSAMAVMARSLGIPARIAVGYAPGAEVGTTKTGARLYEETSNDLHAWPELYFEGIGWVNFEPTPGVGSSTDFAAAPIGQDVTPGGAPIGSQGIPPSQRRDGGLLDASTPLPSDRTSAPRSAVVVLAGLLLAMLVPFALRRAQRSWRVRGSGGSASGLWTELEFTARDYGLFVTMSETPRTFAAELGAWPGMNPEALDRLLKAVERERFGPPGAGADGMADFRAVVGCLRSGARPSQRIRAAIFPRSLFGQPTHLPRPQTI